MRSYIVAAVIALGALSAPAIAQDFDLMQFADTNTDGKVSQEEFAAFSEQGWGFISQGAESIKVADLEPMARGAVNGIAADANGAITHAAYTAAIPGRFKGLDKDGDGALTKAELDAMMAPPAA